MCAVGHDEHLRIDVRTEADRVVLTLHGELDLLGAPMLEKRVEGEDLQERGILVLDLEDVDFIDSAGLRVILSAHERAQQSDQEFALTKGSEQVQRLLTIAGVDEHLRIISTADDVLV